MPPTNIPEQNPSSQQQKDLRPPLYNPEDYAQALRVLFTSSLTLPHHSITPTIILEHSNTNPPLIPGQGIIEIGKSSRLPEMSMKKFINGSELLFKLEADLRSAFPSFVQEFVSGDSEGVSCILDALRTVHEALDHVNGLREQRKLVLDERSCVQCLYLMMRNIDAIPKLLSYPHGLYALVSCTVSTNTSTRIIALEILTSICEQGGNDAFAKISEAFSTLRLRLGEPIRCKVLVGAVSSAAAGVFQAAGIRFFKSFVSVAPSSKFKVYLQVELEEAGFSADVLRKSAELSPARESRLVIQELDEWDRVVVDVDTVVRQNSQLRNSVATLQQEIATLKDRVKKQESPTQQQQQPVQVVYATPHHHQKYKKRNIPRPLSSTPIQTITTPVDSEEEAEQIHQILEDLHNIVNNEMLNDSSSTSDIVPVLQSRPTTAARKATCIRSEPNLFESTTSGDSIDHGRVKDVVQQLENSSLVFNTLPNFNTGGLASKFANFKSSKLENNTKGWGDDDEQEEENLLAESSQQVRKSSRVKSLENLDNFTLKWKYPGIDNGGQVKNTNNNQPNSLIVLQDYRMNRFSKGEIDRSSSRVVGQSSSSSSGLFSKKKKQIHHPQKTFQMSMVGGSKDKGSGGGGFNDLSESPVERVTDLPSGMY